MIAINGGFLLAPMTGVQRFAYQLLIGLLEEYPDVGLRVYVPPLPAAKRPLVDELRRLGADVATAPEWAANKQVFDQLALPRMAARDGAERLVHLNNNVSVATRIPQVCFLYDVAPVRLPHTYRRAYRAKFRAVLAAVRRSKAAVATLSEFSRRELESVGIRVDSVVPGGTGSPMLTEAASGEAATIMSELPDAPFALIVGSADPRKRVQPVIDAWPSVHDATGLGLVVVEGTAPTHRAGSGPRGDAGAVMRLRGRVSDAHLAALAHRSSFTIFASCYEGGALAAQEILALGTPVLASDIPTFRELLGPDVTYFADLDELPLRCGSMLGARRPPALSAVDVRASWRRSAKLFADQLLQL